MWARFPTTMWSRDLVRRWSLAWGGGGWYQLSRLDVHARCGMLKPKASSTLLMALFTPYIMKVSRPSQSLLALNNGDPSVSFCIDASALCSTLKKKYKDGVSIYTHFHEYLNYPTSHQHNAFPSQTLQNTHLFLQILHPTFTLHAYKHKKPETLHPHTTHTSTHHPKQNKEFNIKMTIKRIYPHHPHSIPSHPMPTQPTLHNIIPLPSIHPPIHPCPRTTRLPKKKQKKKKTLAMQTPRQSTPSISKTNIPCTKEKEKKRNI
jgi:hypothetical protein